MSKFLESSRRFIQNQDGARTKDLLRLNIEPFIKVGEIQVNGQENLQKLPPERTIIFAVTHLDDISVQALGYWLLANGYDTYFTQQSSHKKIREAPQLAALMRVVGWERFFPIQSRTKKGKIDARVDFDDYKTIAHAAPRYVVIAAHNPVKPSDEHALPEKSGKAAPLTAAVSGGVIVPVALHIEGGAPTMENPFKGFRRPLTISFGEPIDIFEDQSEESVKSRDALHQRLLGYETGTDRVVPDYLEKVGAQVMQSLAKLLPQKERGSWDSTQKSLTEEEKLPAEESPQNAPEVIENTVEPIS